MNKKAILCLMLIPFFSLAGCNSKQKVSVDETDLKNHISTARHEKIMTRLNEDGSKYFVDWQYR